MPVVEGRRPVNSAVREGLQTGAAQCAFVNTSPIAASRSKLGVFTLVRSPRTLTQSFRSSIETNRMFGRAGSAASRAPASAMAPTTTRESDIRRVGMKSVFVRRAGLPAFYVLRPGRVVFGIRGRHLGADRCAPGMQLG